MPLVLLAGLFLCLTVPYVRWLVRTANRLPWGWDVVLVLGGMLGWFVGWGMTGAWVLVWLLGT